IASTFPAVNQSVTKSGIGTWVLTAANLSTGATNINNGLLILDFSSTLMATNPTADIISPSSVLNFGGGTLNLKGKNGENNSQTFNNGIRVNAGGSALTTTQNGAGDLSITLNAITRFAGSTLDFTLPDTGNITTTTANQDY